MKANQRKKLSRELKILQAKRKVEGRLPPNDAKRLAWLKDFLFDASVGNKRVDALDLADDADTAVDTHLPQTVLYDVSAQNLGGPQRGFLDGLFSESVVMDTRSMTGVTPLDPRPDGGEGSLFGRRANNLTGSRRAIVHLLNGITHRGLISTVDPAAEIVRLDPPPGSHGGVKTLKARTLKSILLMLPQGFSLPEKKGDRIRVKFRNGQALKGVSPDYQPHKTAFTLFPERDRYIERVVVYGHALKDVSFDQ